jgi:ribosomal protein S18 acetylase RimI-like enzyme
MLARLGRSIARLVFSEYSLYRIYLSPAASPIFASTASTQSRRITLVDKATIEGQASTLLKAQAGYAGDGAVAYACFEGEYMAGLCFYWYGSRYRARNFWPLNDDEAKLVQIITLDEYRGRGIAPALIAESFADLASRGFARAFARIWHSNHASLRAFEKAHWSRIAFAGDLHFRTFTQPLRVRVRVGKSRRTRKHNAHGFGGAGRSSSS